MKALIPDFLSFRRFRKVLIVIKSNGVLTLAKILRNKIFDLSFDPLNKVKTSKIENANRLHTDQDLKFASLAGPTMARPFLRFLKANNFSRDGYFVDYGSGKGRALILAARSGFTKLKGIEIVEDWLNLSKVNLLSVKEKLVDCKFYCMNAKDYDPQPEDRFFYFFDPFTDEVLLVCLEKICKSLMDHPRNITIVIHNNYRQEWSRVKAILGDELVFSRHEVLGECYCVWQANQ